MKTLARYALCISTTALLAGCGGSQPLIGAPGAMPQSRAIGMQAPHSGILAAVRVHETSAVERVIYSFEGGSGSTGDGVNPRAGLVNLNGTLYGTTGLGGDYSKKFDFHGFGTVFSVTPYGTETVLHRFVGRDGRWPWADLIAVDGTLYGTTTYGGGHGKGTVFSITPYGTETVLHHFGGVSDGAGPEAGLTDVNGTLYGTTAGGGSSGCDRSGCGTVFSITTSGKETVIHSFGIGEGADPLAGLVSVKGTLYGTTYYGNASGVYGTVFKITRSGKETVLHGFKGGAEDGAEPLANLINVKGTLYGTTSNGGVYGLTCDEGCGTVFSITPSGKEKVLYSFKGPMSDGAYPEASLLNVNGTLYGTTAGGGTHSCGTIFSITTSGRETVLYSFGAKYQDGVGPQAGLINVKGTLYGTTVKGGTDNDGTVFSLSP